MAVPFIDLQRFEDGFLDRWAERCRDLTAATQFVGGPWAAKLETRLAEDAGVAHAIGCANGTDALQLALRAGGVGPGDVVFVPDATFWATPEAVINVGARVVTVDIDPSDLQMSFDLFVEAATLYRPKAAILVHLYGWGSAHLEDFRSFCQANSIELIEDGAQVWATEYGGRPIFEGARISTVSFYPAKVLGSCGDAGAVFTDDDTLAARVRQLGNHGRTSHYEHGLVGWNSRLGGFDAAYLDLVLDVLPDRLASRRRLAAEYRSCLTELGVRTAGPPQAYRENGYLNVTLWDPDVRPGVEAVLRDRGIGFGNVYPGAMSAQPGVRGFLAAQVGGAEARQLSASVLNLPLFAYMRDDELEEVVEAVGAALL